MLTLQHVLSQQAYLSQYFKKQHSYEAAIKIQRPLKGRIFL